MQILTVAWILCQPVKLFCKRWWWWLWWWFRDNVFDRGKSKTVVPD